MIKFISENENTTAAYPAARIEMALHDPESFDGVLNEFIHFALALGYQPGTIADCFAEKAEELKGWR